MNFKSLKTKLRLLQDKPLSIQWNKESSSNLLSYLLSSELAVNSYPRCKDYVIHVRNRFSLQFIWWKPRHRYKNPQPIDRKHSTSTDVNVLPSHLAKQKFFWDNHHSFLEVYWVDMVSIQDLIRISLPSIGLESVANL